MALLLASASPRRKALLSLLVANFDIADPDIDESLLPGESPVQYVARLAAEKAKKCEEGGRAVLGADTTVAVGSKILGKPHNLDSARESLQLLSGRTHQVHTALSLTIDGACESRTTTTAVTFTELSEETIDHYLSMGEHEGKAGAYAIQGYAGAFISRIEGSYSAVVGLPLCETRQLLLSANIPVRYG